MSSSKTTQAFLEKFSQRIGKSEEEAKGLVQKYQAIHGCRCSVQTCDRHSLCHN